MKSWLMNNDVETHSTNNEGKSVFSEWFIRALKNKNYKYITSILKTLYIDKQYDKNNECNNTYRTIEMKPIDINSSTYIEFYLENNDKDPEIEAGDHVKISKYKNIKIGLKKVSWLDKLKKCCAVDIFNRKT